MKTLFLSAAAIAFSQLAFATTINVSFSEDFTEKLADDYGVREGDKLADELVEDLQRQIDKSGLDVARIEVTIIDARPNRPTFKQLGDRPGLDGFRSISLGGMSLEGVAYDAAGETLGTQVYKWYETDIRHVTVAGTWSDARRASDRFSRKFAKTLAE